MQRAIMKKPRINQRKALLVALTSAQGFLAASAFASISDDTINTPTTGPYAIPAEFNVLTITEQGSLSGAPSSAALVIGTGRSAQRIENNGTITGSYNIGNSTAYNAIISNGTIDNLVNTGLISHDIASGQSADLINLGPSSYIGSLINSGSIISESTNSSAINNAGTIGTLQNSDTGLIRNYQGLKNSGHIDTLSNAGIISDLANSSAMMYHQAIENTINGSIGDLENSGTISGMNAASQAIRNLGTIDTLHNTGVITSAYTALSNSGVINTITNGGLISAPTAIEFYNNGQGLSTTTINNSGTIAGNVYNFTSAYNTITFNGGLNTISTITGYNGGIGQIANYYGDVIFTGGYTVLNSNVSSYGGKLLNDATVLQINNPITVNGDYHQNAGAGLVLGVSDVVNAYADSATDSGYGRLIVSGSSTIDEGSHIALVRNGQTYSYAPGQRYVAIVSSGADTNYNAGSLHYTAVGYNGAVTASTYVDGQNKALVLELGEETTTPATPVDPTNPTNPTTPAQPNNPVVSPNKGIATIPGAVAALNGLNKYSGISSPQLLELYNASLAISTKQEANRVGESLSTSQNINASMANMAALSKAITVVGTHMDSVRNQQTAGNSGVSTGDAYENWIFWGQPFGGYARQGSTADVSGYSAKFGGLLLGADRAVGDNWRVGAAVDYSNTSVRGKDSLNGSTSTADNYGVIGYAGYTGQPWYMNLSAALNRQNYESSRQADFTGFSGRAHGKFNGNSVTLQSEFGYPFTLPADVILTPLATFAYGYQHVDDYKETGGNGMALAVDSSHSQSVTSDIGTRVEKTYATRAGKLTPFAQVSWIHQYDNRQMEGVATYAADSIGETRFITKGATPVRDMAGVAVGSTLYDANNLSLDARYDLQAGERYQAHTFSLRLRKTF